MKDDKYFEMTPSLVAPFDESARRTLTVDVSLYEEYLAKSGMSDSDKKEFLEAVWSIVWNFVELGFGVHPLQECCGQNDENPENSIHDDAVHVGSKQEQTQPSGP